MCSESQAIDPQGAPENVMTQLDFDQRRIQLDFEEKLRELYEQFQATLPDDEACFEVPVHVRRVFPGRAGGAIGQFTMRGKAP